MIALSLYGKLDSNDRLTLPNLEQDCELKLPAFGPNALDLFRSHRLVPEGWKGLTELGLASEVFQMRLEFLSHTIFF